MSTPAQREARCDDGGTPDDAAQLDRRLDAIVDASVYDQANGVLQTGRSRSSGQVVFQRGFQLPPLPPGSETVEVNGTAVGLNGKSVKISGTYSTVSPGDQATAHISPGDGEVVVEENGVSTFSSLQAALSDGHTDRMIYYAFDLLHLDGRDLTGSPLIARKEALRELIAEVLEPRPGRLAAATKPAAPVTNTA